jgi:hypothetical protein
MGICLGQAQTSGADVLVICSKGLAGNGCRDAQAAVRRVVDALHPSVQGWRIILVPDERWESACRGFRLKPCPPAFSNLTMRATYLNRRLAVLIDQDGKVDEELARYTTLTGEDRLKWVIAHELGHLLCETADQDVADKVGYSLRVSRHPVGCGNGAPRKNPEVAVSLANVNRIPQTVLASAETTARRIFDGIGVTLRWTAGGGRPLSMQFDYETGRSVHPGALGYAVPYAKTGTRIHILYDRLGVPAESAFAGLLLGHVMAHELAHVLGYAEHSAEGVMKAKWDDNDLVAMRRAPLSFSVEEAAAIRQTVDVYVNEQDETAGLPAHEPAHAMQGRHAIPNRAS